jgi:membrane protein YqaA with SNARE-associated domain
LRRYLEEKLIRGLRRAADRREFPLLAGAAAFCLTLTMTIPVSSALVAASFLSPQRWRSIALYASLGGAVASTLLIVVFHDLGWEQLQERFPEMLETERWQRIIAWTREYGLTALLAVSVLPLPQTPALIIVSVGGPPGGSALLVLFCGKLIKYAAVCGAIALFPQHFEKLHARFLTR